MPWRSGRGRPALPILVAAVALLAIALEEAGHRWRARGLPTAGGEWIWASLPVGATDPVAFWAVRDFELETVPESSSLSLLADEEYVAFLNGRRVGSNRSAGGMVVDRYRVEELLVEGGNRLAIELRSGHGAGGLLAALDLGDGGAPLVTDSAWRIVRRHHPGLLPGWQPLVDAADAGEETVGELVGEAPYSWGRAPVGRWGLPSGVAERPLADTVVGLCSPLPPAVVVADGRGELLDWGREVHGYLTLRFEPTATDGALVGLLLTGAEPRRPLAEPAETVAVVRLPGSATWTDSVPRRFRHVGVAGLPPVAAAEVSPLADLSAAANLPTPRAADPETLFGLRAPLHITPAERAVRRSLDGIEAP